MIWAVALMAVIAVFALVLDGVEITVEELTDEDDVQPGE